MQKQRQDLIPFGVLILLALCACVSHPPLTCKPVPLSPTAAAPLPDPQLFLVCLREIKEVGEASRVQMSDLCSTFLHSPPPK